MERHIKTISAAAFRFAGAAALPNKAPFSIVHHVLPYTYCEAAAMKLTIGPRKASKGSAVHGAVACSVFCGQFSPSEAITIHSYNASNLIQFWWLLSLTFISISFHTFPHPNLAFTHLFT
jgi:hypothetical protein